MPTITLTGVELETVGSSVFYLRPSTLTMTISEGVTLSYSAIAGGAVNSFGDTEVDVTSTGIYTSTLGLAPDDETFIFAFNLTNGETVPILAIFDASTETDHVFSLDPSQPLPTTQGGIDAFLASIDSSDPTSPATGPLAPGTPIDLTDLGVGTVDNDDIWTGDSANDFFEGGSGEDQLDGGTGNDTLSGGTGNDSLNGGSGADSLLGGFGFDTIEGGIGNDTINGEGNADRLYGGGGNDQIIGGDGTDHLHGDDGNDSLYGDSGADRLFGGDGDDLIRAGTNFGTSVDGAEGGAGNDTIFGDGGYDLLLGGTGNDWIDGGNQADNLYGGEGNDTIYGGAGFDRLFGGADDDLLIDNSGIGTFFGGTGNDTMQGGGTEATRFFGGQGDDVVEAGSGNDTIGGNAGFDTIDSGAGNDLIYGDFNADTFVFTSGHGQDTIADFDAFNNFERIDLSGQVIITSLDDLELGSATTGAATQVGDDVLIDTGSGNSILLWDVNLADLDASDFIFPDPITL